MAAKGSKPRLPAGAGSSYVGEGCAPVAGISCGLISDKETGTWRTFTDIQGVEDFHAHAADDVDDEMYAILPADYPTDGQDFFPIEAFAGNRISMVTWYQV